MDQFSAQGQTLGYAPANASDWHLRQQALSLASYRGAINAVTPPSDTRSAKEIVADAELYLAFLKGGETAPSKSN